jgi:hypothetical protein
MIAIERLTHTFSPVPMDNTIVIGEHQVVTSRNAYTSISSSAGTDIFARGNIFHVWHLFTHSLTHAKCIIRGPIIHHNDFELPGLESLSSNSLQGSLKQNRPIIGTNDYC